MDFIKNVFARKTKRMSFMPFLPTIMPPSRKVILEFRMVNKPHGHSWRDVHEIGEEADYRPAKDADDEMNVENDDMEVTCQLSDNDTLIESHKVKASFFYTRYKYTVYLELDLTDKADESLVTLSVKHSKHQMDIKFRTHFLEQVDTPPQEASAAAGEVSTSKFRSANIQEQELLNLALDVPSSKYTELCIVLGVSYNESRAILAIHQRDFTTSLIRVLCEWKDKHGVDTDCRNGIAAALRDVNLNALGDNFSRGGYHPQEAAPTGNIEDKELVNLACDVPRSKYTELCTALGVSLIQSQNIIDRHRQDFTTSLIAVFCEWKNRQRGGTDCRNVIATALRGVNLDELGDKMSRGGYLPQEAAPTGNIQDKELVNLACDVLPSKYTELCTALGVSLNQSQTILDRHLHDFTNSLIAVFRDWKNRQRGGTDCRNGIATALRDVQMDGLGEKMSRGGYLPQEAAPTDTTETSSMESVIASQRPKSFTSVDVSNSKARTTEESMEQDFDDLLKTVAHQIHKDCDIHSLGRELGFQPQEIQRYIQTNEKYLPVKYIGTLSMLRNWRKRTKRSEERIKLKRALIAIKHHRLADDLMNVDIDRKPDSESLRPSASKSVNILHEDASAAAGEVPTSQARPTEESMEEDFDNLLKTGAQQIHKDADIDSLEISETSPGKRDSASPRPSASTLVDISPQDASAAAGEVSTSEARF